MLSAPSLQVFVYIDEIPLCFLFSRLSSPSLSSQEGCSSPFIFFVALHWSLSTMPMSLLG